MPCMSRGMPTATRHHYPTLQEAMALIGVTIDLSTADWPVFEGNYIKFMGGPAYDKAACDQFVAWLEDQGYHYDRHRDRAVRNLCNRAVLSIARAFGWTNDEILENAVCLDDQAWFERVLGEEGSARTWATPKVTLSAQYV